MNPQLGSRIGKEGDLYVAEVIIDPAHTDSICGYVLGWSQRTFPNMNVETSRKQTEYYLAIAIKPHGSTNEYLRIPFERDFTYYIRIESSMEWVDRRLLHPTDAAHSLIDYLRD